MQLQHLKTLHETMIHKSKSFPYCSPTELRNIILHRHAQSDIMRLAKDLFFKYNLWARNGDGNIRHYFLNQECIRNVFQELGIDNPEVRDLYDGLVEGLLSNLSEG